MNTIKKISLLLLLGLFLFNSCTNSKLPDDSLKQVPEDVTAVTAFNINQLMQKADFEYIKTLDFYNDALADLEKEQPTLAAILENPLLSGVDLTKNAYVVMDIDKNDPQEKQFGGLVFSISDAAKFESLLQILHEETATSRADFLFHEGGNQLVAWNDNFGVIAGGHHSMDLEAFVTPYFDKSRKTSVANNKDLVKCLAKDYDVAVWANTNAIADNPQLKTAASFLGISKESLKGNYFHSFLNFEDGFIAGESKHYFQKELTDDLNLFFKDGVKQDLSKYIPGEHLGLVFSAALDAKGIYQVISEKTGGITAVNAALKRYGFTSKDLANAIGGDVVVAVYSNDNNEAIPNGLLAGSIGDNKLFQQFLDLGVQFEILSPEENGMYAIKEGPKEMEQSYILVKEKVFFVSNEKSMLNKIKDGGYNATDRIPSDIYTTLSNNSFGGAMNFDGIKGFAKEFQHLPFASAQMDAGLHASHMKLEMEEKGTNSLKVLFGLLNDWYVKDGKIIGDKEGIQI